jgi:hypothetical protein
MPNAIQSENIVQGSGQQVDVRTKLKMGENDQ